MILWTIKVYSNDKETSALDKWFKNIPEEAWIEINTRLRYLRTQKIWERPWAAKLKKVKDIYEIRVKSENVQYRPLGFFNTNLKEFTLLIGAIEKGNKFEPHDADKTAEKRRNLIVEGKKYAINYFNDEEEEL